MKLSDQELIAIGLQVQEARRKGGVTIFKKYGREYYKELNKRSVASRQAKKNAEKLV